MEDKNKKKFFSFFKRAEKNYDTSEDVKQREFALSKKQNEDTRTTEESEDQDRTKYSPEIVSFCQEKMQQILEASGISGSKIIAKNKQEKMYLEITNEKETGRIIGKDGAHLHAFQTIINAMAYKKYAQPIRLEIDANDYKYRKLESLKSNALRSAKYAQLNKTKVELEPMNAAERREIHMLFQDDQEIKSFSVGEGRERHIVIDALNES